MTFQLGSVSTGTMRTEDLLPAFARALISFVGRPEYHRIERPLMDRALEITNGDTPAYPQSTFKALFDTLNELCPPFVYFGAHPGDGADFGFWPDWDALDDGPFSDMCICDECDNKPFELVSEGHIINVDYRGNVTVMDLDRNVLWSTI